MKKPQDPENCNNSEPEPEKKVNLRGEEINKKCLIAKYAPCQ